MFTSLVKPLKIEISVATFFVHPCFQVNQISENGIQQKFYQVKNNFMIISYKNIYPLNQINEER